MVNMLAHAVTPDQQERFVELTQQKEPLDQEAARELAQIVLPLYGSPDEESVEKELAYSVEELIDTWQKIAALGGEKKKFGFTDGAEGGNASETSSHLEVAGGDVFRKLDPRQLYRVLTVRQMKDRAGKVGAYGVSQLLRRVLKVSNARVHLIGHSYGTKVMLSGLCYGADLPRQVSSALLLQPAISHLSFAESVPGTDHPGGYTDAPKRVMLPIMSTFTRRDGPLHKFFHLALRRKKDLGEKEIGGGDDAPSHYAAMGGYGPSEAGAEIIDIKLLPERYDFGKDAPEIYGLKAHETISGHGDISNESTWWALYNLVTSS